MTLTVADLDRWEPAAVLAVATAAGRRADAAAAARSRLTGLPALDGWNGVAAGAARAALADTAAELDRIAAESTALAHTAARAAENVAAIRSELADLDAAAHRAGLMIVRPTGEVRAPDGTRSDATPFGRLGAAISAQVADLLRRASDLDAELAARITAAAGPPHTPDPATPSPPFDAPAGTTPGDVGSWWRSLSPADREALIAGDPDRFGHLDGIPAATRDVANRSVLQADLRRVSQTAAHSGATIDEVLADPYRYGLPASAVTRYANAARIAEALHRNAVHTSAQTLLLIYRPEAFAGQGRAALSIGDPDKAAHTAVLVPGTGSTVDWLSDPSLPWLYAETTAAGDQSTALVAYAGYDAPDSLIDPRVTGPELAREGGALLAADVNALAVTSERGSHLTVIGHSYGSTTVADAAALHGMRVDDIILLGSPGTDMARTATDFGLPEDGRVYVGTASTDPVTMLSGLPGPIPGTRQPVLEVGLGADPTADGFGSTRFKAEVPGFTLQPWEDHTRYLEPGSESLFSIAHIAVGQGSALQDHGMTAPHRTGILGRLGAELGLPTWSGPLSDPELSRPATTGHFH